MSKKTIYNSPFFSIIIPTYNRSNFLLNAIQSVLKQTLKSFEIIIVDDNSNDDTKKKILEFSNMINKNLIIKNDFFFIKTLQSKCVEIESFLESEDQNFKYIKLKKNNGVSISRNIGSLFSRYNFLCFLDSDDLWHKNKLQKQSKVILSNKDIHLIHTNEKWLFNGKHLNKKNIHKVDKNSFIADSLMRCMISPSSVCIKKNIFFDCNGFNEDYTVCEDYDLWLKFLFHYNISYIDEKLVTKHGGHEGQLSKRFNGMDYWRVKSLIYLLKRNKSDNFLEICTQKEIKRIILFKSKILSDVFLKYNNNDKLTELNEMLSRLN
jgi:glycosyltransferase involved in cell wall biosynthesis